MKHFLLDVLAGFLANVLAAVVIRLSVVRYLFAVGALP